MLRFYDFPANKDFMYIIDDVRVSFTADAYIHVCNRGATIFTPASSPHDLIRPALKITITKTDASHNKTRRAIRKMLRSDRSDLVTIRFDIK